MNLLRKIDKRLLLAVPSIFLVALAAVFVFEATVAHSKIRITNRSSESFALVWTTNRPIRSKVWISQTQDYNLAETLGTSNVYFDDRGSNPRYEHHVTVDGLEADTSYYVWLGSSIFRTQLSETGNHVTTYALNDEIAEPDPVYGTLLSEESKPQADAVVTLKVENRVNPQAASETLSTITNEHGGWQIDLSDLRYGHQEEEFDFGSDDRFNITIESRGQGYSVLMSASDYQPLKDIMLTELGTSLISESEFVQQSYYSPNSLYKNSAKIQRTATLQEESNSDVLGAVLGHGSSCHCYGGKYYDGTDVTTTNPASSCGSTIPVCGGDYKNYYCSYSGSWTNSGVSCGPSTTPPPPSTSTSCTGGVLYNGTPLGPVPNSEYRCGLDQWYQCVSGNWQAKGYNLNGATCKDGQFSDSSQARNCTGGVRWDNAVVTLGDLEWVCGKDQWYQCDDGTWRSRGESHNGYICRNSQAPYPANQSTPTPTPTVNPNLSCTGGVNYNGSPLGPVDNFSWVCGIDQWYQCINGNWQNQGRTHNGLICEDGKAPFLPPQPTTSPTPTPVNNACTCTNGKLLDGTPIDPSTTDCSTRVCGQISGNNTSEGRYYECTATGWSNTGESCFAPNPTATLQPTGVPTDKSNCPSVPGCDIAGIFNNNCRYIRTSTNTLINQTISVQYQSVGTYTFNYADYNTVVSQCSFTPTPAPANSCLGQCAGDTANQSYSENTTCWSPSYQQCYTCGCVGNQCEFNTVDKFAGCIQGQEAVRQCSELGGVWHSTTKRCVAQGVSQVICVNKYGEQRTVGVDQSCPVGFYYQGSQNPLPQTSIPQGCCVNSNQCTSEEVCSYDSVSASATCKAGNLGSCIGHIDEVPDDPEEDQPIWEIPDSGNGDYTCKIINNQHNTTQFSISEHPGIDTVDLNDQNGEVYSPRFMEIVYRRNTGEGQCHSESTCQTIYGNATGFPTLYALYGRTIVGKDTENGQYYLYAHMNSIPLSLSPGRASEFFPSCNSDFSNAPCANGNNNVVVPPCAFLGRSGNTGDTKGYNGGYHLHFEHITCNFETKTSNRYHNPQCQNNPTSEVANATYSPVDPQLNSFLEDPYTRSGGYTPSYALENGTNIAEFTLKQQNVLGGNTEDSPPNPEDVLLDPGKYIFEGGPLEGTEVIVDEQGVVLRFFEDLNNNLQRDANEPYLSEQEVRAKISKVSDLMELELNEGWNLVGFNTFSKNWNSASKLFSELRKQNLKITHLFQYVNGKWGSYSERFDINGNIEIYGEDFNLIPGRGYFIKSPKKMKVNLFGQKYDDSIPFNVTKGWNLISVQSENPYDAEKLLRLCDVNSSIECSLLARYGSGKYEVVIKDAGIFYGNSFKLNSKSGYFLRVDNGSGQLDPK